MTLRTFSISQLRPQLAGRHTTRCPHNDRRSSSLRGVAAVATGPRVGAAPACRPRALRCDSCSASEASRNATRDARFHVAEIHVCAPNPSGLSGLCEPVGKRNGSPRTIVSFFLKCQVLSTKGTLHELYLKKQHRNIIFGGTLARPRYHHPAVLSGKQSASNVSTPVFCRGLGRNGISHDHIVYFNGYSVQRYIIANSQIQKNMYHLSLATGYIL